MEELTDVNLSPKGIEGCLEDRVLFKRDKGDIINDCYSIKKISSSKDIKLNTFDNQIEIDFKGTETATKQIEYLVYFNLFIEKLKDRNIFLEQEVFFDEDIINTIVSDDLFNLNNLNNKEKELNRLYKYFIFRKSSPIEIEPQILSTLNPLILSKNNYKYISRNEINGSLIEPIKIYTHVDHNMEVLSRNNYYRVGAIGSDNNCFFHSILISNDLKTYNSLSYKEKVMCASKLREDTIKNYKCEQDEIKLVGVITDKDNVKYIQREVDDKGNIKKIEKKI
jgi:hypothetical protein